MAMEKDIAVEESPHHGATGVSNDGFHEDREMGLETVDIERIEKVYR